MDHLQSNIFIAGQRLNDLTGYSGIEALKKDIEQQELQVQATRTTLQKAKADYTLAISQRSSSQREVNELLQRKHAWTPNDLERFTELYRSDHANEQSETAAQETLLTTERRAEEAAAKLSASILARYHEEQIWSDKIRRMSTWGTWGLMGVNVLLFLVFQIGVEPWRRKRLVKGFEEKVKEALEREGSAVGAPPLGVQVAQDASSAEVQAVQGLTTPAVVEDAQIPAAADPSPESSLPVEEDVPSDIVFVESSNGSKLDLQQQYSKSILGSIRAWIQDIFSERQIVLRRIDVTTAILEGAAAGVTFVGTIVLLLRLRS